MQTLPFLGEILKEDEFKAIFRDTPWFVDVVEFVKDARILHKINITDILIKTNAPIQVGIVKSFYDISEFDFVNTKMAEKFRKYEITRNDLERFKYIFKENGYLSEEQAKRTSVDMSLAIYRVGIVRINYSKSMESIVMNIRFLDFTLPDFSYVGYPETYIDFITSLPTIKDLSLGVQTVQHRVVSQGGLIIHSGPTGSGKSTAIASEVKYFAEATDGLIITYEEPIEYRFVAHTKVLQYEIDRDIARHEIKRHALRNTPTIIVWGEVRTKDELADVVDLSTRGHLVIVTLHASDVYGVLKFISIALGESEIANFATTLKAIVSHRMIINTQGEIVNLFETLINNYEFSTRLTDLRNHMTMKEIYNMLYKDKSIQTFRSFKDDIEDKRYRGKLSEEDFINLMNALGV
ncbi:MAG TPA: hypothetical protein ENO30_05010 [Thermodesulfobium narugense]|nr:hypothetical protein [Thermodesulfobium narugense]